MAKPRALSAWLSAMVIALQRLPAYPVAILLLGTGLEMVAAARISLVEPAHGAHLIHGRTPVTWQVQNAEVGEHVSIYLDGDLMAITSAKADGGLHLMGAAHGRHKLVVTLSRTPIKARTWIHGAIYGDVVAVQFVSVSEEGGEWLTELAALRSTFLRSDTRLLQLDSHTRIFEQALQNTQQRLREGAFTCALPLPGI